MNNSSYNNPAKLVATHNVGNYVLVSEDTKMFLLEIVTQIKEEDRNVYRTPFYSRYEISDIFLSIAKYGQPAYLIFTVWIQPMNTESKDYERLKKTLYRVCEKMNLPFNYMEWATTERVGCTFEPNTFWGINFLKEIDDKMFVSLGVPHDEEGCSNYWNKLTPSQTNYWSTVPRWNGKSMTTFS